MRIGGSLLIHRIGVRGVRWRRVQAIDAERVCLHLNSCLYIRWYIPGSRRLFMEARVVKYRSQNREAMVGPSGHLAVRVLNIRRAAGVHGARQVGTPGG